jgi:hypothetical protein
MWDRIVLMQAAMAAQFFGFIANTIRNTADDTLSLNALVPQSAWMPWAMTIFLLLSFILVVATTIVEREWPFRLRCSLIALDGSLVAILIWFSMAAGNH